MSAAFKGFGEPARLYAKYKAVVDEMQKAYEADIDAYLDALGERLLTGLPGLRVEQSVFGNNRYWWTEDDEKPADDDVPYVWVNQSDSRIINGNLRTVVWADGVSAAFKQAVNAEAGLVSLPSHCTSDRSSGWFAMTITLGDDPVEAAAEPILLLLQAIRKSYLGFTTSSSRKAAGRK